MNKPKNAWERLVAEVGLEEAKNVMRERGAKADNSKRTYNDKAMAKAAVNKRWEQYREKKRQLEANDNAQSNDQEATQE